MLKDFYVVCESGVETAAVALHARAIGLTVVDDTGGNRSTASLVNLFDRGYPVLRSNYNEDHRNNEKTEFLCGKPGGSTAYTVIQFLRLGMDDLIAPAVPETTHTIGGKRVSESTCAAALRAYFRD